MSLRYLLHCFSKWLSTSHFIDLENYIKRKVCASHILISHNKDHLSTSASGSIGPRSSHIEWIKSTRICCYVISFCKDVFAAWRKPLEAQFVRWRFVSSGHGVLPFWSGNIGDCSFSNRPFAVLSLCAKTFCNKSCLVRFLKLVRLYLWTIWACLEQ